jgi:transcriptional regulator with XRE-family HTH domain
MPKQIRKLIGDALRRARVSARLRQEDVATDFLRSRQAISSWECGKTLPSLEEFRDLLTLYGVSADQVLFGVDSTAAEMQGAMERASAPAAIPL